MSYVVKKKTFMDGRIRIPGEMYIPDDGEGKYPTVIYSHGLGAGRSSAYKYLDTFEKFGTALICFDFPGGGSNDEQVKNTEMSVRTELDNLRAVMDEALTLDFVDEERLILMGSSQGGAVSALLAAERPEKVSRLILCYPAFVIQDMIRSAFKSIEEMPDYYEHPFLTVGKKYGVDAWDLDMFSIIGNYRGEVLILHGDLDELVPIRYSEKAMQIYENAEFHVIEGSGHGFFDENVNKANRILEDYLTKKGLG